MTSSDSSPDEFEPRFVTLFAKVEIVITPAFILSAAKCDQKFQIFKLVAG
jgi:hypothetical protein